ncbi:hypothetical protein J2129_000814 [Methanofollis sp. W23]|uniref:hypothetical protein n=1 Tax=Methanofollis sp. W23 TaxID=2817849 RepID=UPI001AE76EF2|nr:hypothetical protein [Methanofollis sp. W23]MBP2145360.1 hypothetical protein [Methanofollis sp. W23]
MNLLKRARKPCGAGIVVLVGVAVMLVSSAGALPCATINLGLMHTNGTADTAEVIENGPVTAPVGTNTFTALCNNTGDQNLDGQWARYELTVWDTEGYSHTDAWKTDRAGSHTLELRLHSYNAGDAQYSLSCLTGTWFDAVQKERTIINDLIFEDTEKEFQGSLVSIFPLAPMTWTPGEEVPVVSLETIPPEEVQAPVAEAERHARSVLTDAVAGDAVQVTSLDRTLHDFCLIPFFQDDELAAVAEVSLAGAGTSPHFKEWKFGHPDPAAALTRLSLGEATWALGRAGYTGGNWTARVVSMGCDAPLRPYFWECENEEEEKVYVGYDRYDEVIRVYTGVTPGARSG